MALGPEKRLERRARILQATHRLIAERGYRELTVADIARECGVAVATLYNGFGSKDGLLAAAVESNHRQMLAIAEKTAGAGGLNRVLATLETLTAELERDPAFFREMTRIFTHMAETQSSRVDARAMLGDVFARGLGEMGQRGEVVEWLEPRSVADSIVLHISGVMRVWVAGGHDVGWFRSRMMFGACLLLVGVTRRDAKVAIEARLRGLSQAMGDEDAA